MKRYLLLFAAIISLNASAQNFIPMLDEINEWSVIFRDGFTGDQLSRTYSIQGEEIINGVTYKTIHGGIGGGSCPLREANGVVYFYDTCNNTEAIMLDFNLEVGDIFYVGPNVCNECSFSHHSDLFDEIIVVNNYTEFIAGEDRKVLEFTEVVTSGSTYYSEFWIEGIGSTAGISPASINADFDHLLICFRRNGETTYFNEFNSCEYVLNTASFIREQIVLSPNPIIDSATLTIPSEALVDTIKVYDLSGRLVLIETVNSTTHTIGAGSFNSGLYFYQVLSEEKIVKAEKFIVR